MDESSEFRQSRENRLYLDELVQSRMVELEQVVAREQHQRQLAESLREIGVTLSSSLDQNEVLGKILAHVAVIIHHDGGAIFLREAESLVLIQGIGPTAVAHEGEQIPLTSQNPTVRTFYSEQPLIINSGADEPYWLDWPEGDTLYAWMGIPLIIGEDTVGVLTLDRYEPDNDYTEADAQTLQIFAEQAALAIRNARLYEALQKSEERFRTVWDISSDALALSDPEGIVLAVNPAYLKLYGFTAQEVIDQPFNIIFPEDQRDWALEQYKEVFASPTIPPTFNSVIHRADGTEHIVETTIGFITQEGERTAMLSSIRDVTEQRRAESARRESEAQQRAILEAIPDVIFRLNRDGVYLDAHGAEGVTEVPVAGRVGRKVEEVLPSDLAKKVRHNIEKALATKEIIHSQHQLHWQTHFYDTRYVAINEDEVIMIIRDVTQQHHLEEQLRQSQKMEAVGQLAGGVAHHYNNLLTAIVGYVSLSLTQLPSNHPIAKDLERIQSTAQRAAILTRQLLTFTSKQPARLEVINFNNLIRNAKHLLRSLLSSSVEIQTILAPDLASVQIDGAQFEQVLFNLVGNARDAMPSQGGELLIQTANVTLEEPDEIPAGDYVQVIVRDNGHGISEAVKDRIFEPFFTTKDIDQGTGLGLSTCYGIITQHHGYITVDSEFGQGATFCIYLPRYEAIPTTAPTDQRLALTPQGKETVLLVEDNADVRDLVSLVLQRQGYTLLEAEDSRAALKLLDTQPLANLDLLVTDVVMPRMGGVALVRELRTRYPRLKVLMMSGYRDDILSQQEILELDIVFLAKPFSPVKLAQSVRAILDTLPTT